MIFVSYIFFKFSKSYNGELCCHTLFSKIYIYIFDSRLLSSLLAAVFENLLKVISLSVNRDI